MACASCSTRNLRKIGSSYALLDYFEVIPALDKLHAQLVVDTVAEVGVDVLYLLRREMGVEQLIDAVEVFFAQRLCERLERKPRNALNDLRLELVRGAAVVEVDVGVRPRDENQLEVHGDVGFRESALNLPAPRGCERAKPRQHIAAEFLLADCWGVLNVVDAALNGLPLCEAVRLIEPAVEYTDDFLCVNRFHAAPPFHPSS